MADLQAHLQTYFQSFRLTSEDTTSMLKAFGVNDSTDRITLQNYRDMLDNQYKNLLLFLFIIFRIQANEDSEDQQTRKIVIYQVNVTKPKSENKE